MRVLLSSQSQGTRFQMCLYACSVTGLAWGAGESWTDGLTMGHHMDPPPPNTCGCACVCVSKNHVAFSDFFFPHENMWFWYNFGFVYLGLVVKLSLWKLET